MTWIVKGFDPIGIRPWRRKKAPRGPIEIDAFVRPVLVVEVDELVESFLLVSKGSFGRTGGSSFQITVHAFMRAILLRLAWVDEHGLHTKLHEANTERGQPCVSSRAKGRTIVAEHGSGKPMLTKHTLDDLPGSTQLCRGQRLTRQNIATERINHGQGIAVPAVA